MLLRRYAKSGGKMIPAPPYVRLLSQGHSIGVLLMDCFLTPPLSSSLVSNFRVVSFNNVPHAQLAEYKGGQNWITVDKDKFKFPGGGTQFIYGAGLALDHISKMVPNIGFGSHTRVVLDVGCGVASFGAYLFSRNAVTKSVESIGLVTVLLGSNWDFNRLVRLAGFVYDIH